MYVIKHHTLTASLFINLNLYFRLLYTTQAKLNVFPKIIIKPTLPQSLPLTAKKALLFLCNRPSIQENKNPRNYHARLQTNKQKSTDVLFSLASLVCCFIVCMGGP